MAGAAESKTTNNQQPPALDDVNALAQLLDFEGSSGNYLAKLVSTLCRLAGAESGVIIRLAQPQGLEMIAAFPDPDANGSLLDWIGTVEKQIRKALESGETVFGREKQLPTTDGQSRLYSVVIPIQNPGSVSAAAVFRVRSKTYQALLVTSGRLEVASLLFRYHELHLKMKKETDSAVHLRRVLETVDAVNRTKRFLSAAMAMCNEIAVRMDCSRVSLGILGGRCVRAQAISHTDTFSRKMSVVQAIEAAMEECLDQDEEIIHPASDGAMTVNRAAAALSKSHGPSCVLSLPIRDEGEATAVITMERSPEAPFQSIEEIEVLRLICELCAPRLLDLHQNDRWFGAQLAARMRRQAAVLMGHRYTWTKAAAVLVFFAMVFLITGKGEYRIKTSFSLKARNQQVVVAPFDTFTKSIRVEPGDRVEGGKTELGTLETSELRLKLAVLKAERLGYQKQMVASMRDRKTADAQMAQAQSDKADAQIRLIERQIEKASLVAPITGWVVSDDLKQRIGAPVETGKVLFEIAGIDSLRAELYVPESSISRIATGQAGELAAVGHPDQRVRFVIDKIHPTAEVVNSQNVFKISARILEQLQWMRPGMEGEARIFAGKKSYLWIASHRIVNWLRMKLWL